MGVRGHDAEGTTLLNNYNHDAARLQVPGRGDAPLALRFTPAEYTPLDTVTPAKLRKVCPLHSLQSMDTKHATNQLVQASSAEKTLTDDTPAKAATGKKPESKPGSASFKPVIPPELLAMAETSKKSLQAK
eukprot:4696228-Amphidinium_carterae.5